MSAREKKKDRNLNATSLKFCAAIGILQHREKTNPNKGISGIHFDFFRRVPSFSFPRAFLKNEGHITEIEAAFCVVRGRRAVERQTC